MLSFSWYPLRAPRAVACVFSLVLAFALSSGMAAAGPAQDLRQPTVAQLLPPIQDPSNPGGNPPPDTIGSDQDSDGDGIPNAQDPDDDNGGTSDDQDPAPFDPNVEPPPPSSPTSPIHDDDGDGIPNIQDPDDDNDGTADDEDPGDPDPAPVTGGGGNGGTGSRGETGGTGGNGTVPVVSKLPTTGAGDVGPTSIPAGFALAAATLALIALTARVTQRR